MPPCDIHIDSELTKNIIDSVPENAVIHLASGYFNLTEELVDAILLSKAKINLLMAHPTVNLCMLRNIQFCFHSSIFILKMFIIDKWFLSIFRIFSIYSFFIYRNK